MTLRKIIPSGRSSTARGLLGILLLLAVREPLALTAGAILLWPGSRRSNLSLGAALAAPVIPAFAWGMEPALLAFQTALVGVLSAGHLDFALWTRPGRLAPLVAALAPFATLLTEAGAEARALRTRMQAARDWRQRRIIVTQLLPTLTPRRVRPLVEVAGWATLSSFLVVLFVAAAPPGASAPDSSPVFLASTPSGEVVLESAGTYRLDGPEGGITVVHDGASVRVVARSCREGRCERMSVDRGGIACAPNRIAIRRATPRADRHNAPASRQPKRGPHAWTG